MRLALSRFEFEDYLLKASRKARAAKRRSFLKVSSLFNLSSLIEA
jgi:hypothetical protein